MPDNVHNITNYLIIALGGLWAFLMRSWWRLVGRADIMQESLAEKVDREEYNATISSLRTDIKDSANRIFDKIDATHREQNERLDRLTESVHTRRRGESQE